MFLHTASTNAEFTESMEGGCHALREAGGLRAQDARHEKACDKGRGSEGGRGLGEREEQEHQGIGGAGASRHRAGASRHREEQEHQGIELVMLNVGGERRQVLKSKPTADVDIVRAKLRLVQEQLDHLRGGGGGERGGGGGCDGGGEVGAGAMAGESNAVRVGDVDDGGDGEGGGVGVVVDTRASPACITAGLAAELGSKWGARSVEPREGLRLAVEGTLEEAPEPCMLAQGTIDTAQRLWHSVKSSR